MCHCKLQPSKLISCITSSLWIDVEHLVFCFLLTVTCLWRWVCLTSKLYLFTTSQKVFGDPKVVNKYQLQDCRRYFCLNGMTLIVLGPKEINILQGICSWTPHQGPIEFLTKRLIWSQFGSLLIHHIISEFLHNTVGCFPLTLGFLQHLHYWGATLSLSL